ncbi:MAG: YdcF family protein [Oscillospiraceae bacterium]
MNGILLSIFLGGFSTIAGILFLFVGLAPFMIYGFSHIGAIVATIFGFLLIAFPILYKKKPLKIAKYLWIFTAIISTIAAGFCYYMSIFAYTNQYKLEEPPTVIVLGCQVKNGMPSVTLANRLNKAYEVLAKYPEANCIVSGGLTPGEPMSEAQVMSNYLVEKGIAADRILLEDKSTSTSENILYSKDIIIKNNLPQNIVIASDGYHQFRSAQIVKQYGFTPYCASSKSPTGLAPSYYVREFLALIYTFVLKL